MTAEDFATLVGDRLLHITPAVNAAGIASHGLRSAAALAGDAVDAILLRRDRRQLQTPAGIVQLNHQLPLYKGRNQSFLDDHTLESWSAQLDRRIYFFPAGKGAGFAQSFAQATVTIALNSRRLFDALSEHLFLSPINSGNADRRASRRGDWIYVPVTASVEDFRHNRRRRGWVQRPDRVAKVSLTTALPADTLQSCAA